MVKRYYTQDYPEKFRVKLVLVLRLTGQFLFYIFFYEKILSI